MFLRPEISYKSPTANDSFGQEVLCATNSIFSSFQNSRKVFILKMCAEILLPKNETSFTLRLLFLGSEWHRKIETKLTERSTRANKSGQRDVAVIESCSQIIGSQCRGE